MIKHILLALTAALLTLTGVAMAANNVIDTAKNECIIGEQIDGYIGVIEADQVSTELDRELRSVNQRRKAVYADLAEKNGVTVQVAAQLTAEKLLAEAAEKGHCYHNAQGQWVRR